MGTARRSVVVIAAALLASAGGVVQPASGQEGTHCTFSFEVTLSPGLSSSGTSGTHSSSGEVGVLDCHGPVNGYEPTGTGTLGDEGRYGTADPDTCASGGEGDGVDTITVPTADGPQRILSDFTFTYGDLSTKGGVVHGEFTGTRFSGSFEFTPTQGDCVTSPVTKAAVTGEGVLR